MTTNELDAAAERKRSTAEEIVRLHELSKGMTPSTAYTLLLEEAATLGLELARDVLAQHPTYAELAARLAKLEQENARLVKVDFPELDCTDAAHPAWWRGNDHAYTVMCKEIAELLDGKELAGACAQPWQGVRKRIASLRAAVAEAVKELRATILEIEVTTDFDNIEDSPRGVIGACNTAFGFARKAISQCDALAAKLAAAIEGKGP